MPRNIELKIKTLIKRVWSMRTAGISELHCKKIEEEIEKLKNFLENIDEYSN
jgi:hypothetical protein